MILNVCKPSSLTACHFLCSHATPACKRSLTRQILIFALLQTFQAWNSVLRSELGLPLMSALLAHMTSNLWSQPRFCPAPRRPALCNAKRGKLVALALSGEQTSKPRLPYSAQEGMGNECASSMVVVDNDAHERCTKLMLDVEDHPGKSNPASLTTRTSLPKGQKGHAGSMRYSCHMIHRACRPSADHCVGLEW